jgi:hypothetical protein
MDKKISISRPVREKLARLYLRNKNKRAEGMAQQVETLPGGSGFNLNY